ncbi:hypothetical protein [Paraflavitalea speifideaquila]|uniref:hypothetical protein n=1 Tax=Paraflavitalea speifideaquila TaxID=3076558 RepID=UPI0028E505EE|nr:hypothetical protein [Paraflavitalea speifideiaquila]
MTILLLAFRQAAHQNHQPKVPATEIGVTEGTDSVSVVELVDSLRLDTLPARVKAVGKRTDSVIGINFIAIRDTGRYAIDASLDGPGTHASFMTIA